MNSAAGTSVSLTLDGPSRPLSESAELAAYRVVQESLTNTRKHGGLAAAASVTLRYEPNGLLLQVTDDGLGAAAPADGDETGPGHGLIGNLHYASLANMGGLWPGTHIPKLDFMAFQMMFSIITPALITGALAGRLKFGAWIVISAGWSPVRSNHLHVTRLFPG